jgi:hypothetical protein
MNRREYASVHVNDSGSESDADSSSGSESESTLLELSPTCCYQACTDPDRPGPIPLLRGDRRNANHTHLPLLLKMVLGIKR